MTARLIDGATPTCPPAALVEACARAEYERFAAAITAHGARSVPAWDDEIGMRRMFGREARIDAMRARLEVLWPVIIEYLGWA